METPADPRADFSEWLHAELVSEFGDERARWALDRIGRVQQRLNECRPGKPPLEATILQITPPLAFTPFGRHVYDLHLEELKKEGLLKRADTATSETCGRG